MQINSNVDGKYDCHDTEEHSTNHNTFRDQEIRSVCEISSV